MHTPELAADAQRSFSCDSVSNLKGPWSDIASCRVQYYFEKAEMACGYKEYVV